jgi:rfaE bifunctional protein nucleotidyltransferase chain/domain
MRNWRDKIILDHGELEKKLDAERAAGKKVVFTNGAFDILHVGHLRSFFDAKEHADILLVAMNSDESVRRSKGPGRPVSPLGERMEVIAAIECVDLVTAFSEDTVDALLLRLKPDFHAKGTDYTKETVPERETVLSYGGEILIVGDPKEHSSSELIEKIKRVKG